MPKTIGRLKIRDSRSFLPHTLITLLIAVLLSLTSVSLADGNQLLFHLKDLKDPGSLAVKLQDTRAAISQVIATQLSVDTQQLLSEYDGIDKPSPALQKALLDDLNRLLQAAPFYDIQHLANIKLSEQTQELLAPKSSKRRRIGASEPLPLGRCLSL